MSYNAVKYQKPKARKHNQKCTATPDKIRYRDTKEAQQALSMFRARRKADLAKKGYSRFQHDNLLPVRWLQRVPPNQTASG